LMPRQNRSFPWQPVHFLEDAADAGAVGKNKEKRSEKTAPSCRFKPLFLS
jgi:hypothetical protein